MSIYLFLLLALPTAPACTLWLSAPPTQADLRAACPLNIMAPLEWYEYRAADGCTSPLAGDWLCAPVPGQVEVWLTSPVHACTIWTDSPSLSGEDVRASCPDRWADWQAGRLEVRGPFPIQPEPEPAPTCILPPVNNSGSLATAEEYEFLAGRLSWWGMWAVTPLDWQNRFDEQIRGAADAAGVPARLLKSMIAVESQFWPLWTGDAGEAGWLQVTWAGADIALRHNEHLFWYYCQQALHAPECQRGYDLLAGWQKTQVQAALVADLTVTGTPLQAAEAAASDLWTSAQILRGFACWGRALQPDGDAWSVAAVLYNAGQACLLPEGFCQAGEAYLRKVLP